MKPKYLIMKNLSILGKFLFLLPFAVFGILHLMNAGAMAGMVPAYVPGGVLWVYVSGLALIAAPVAVIIGQKSKLALQLLGLMLLLFVLMIHLPTLMGGDQNAMAAVLKDLSLCGAAWLLADKM